MNLENDINNKNNIINNVIPLNNQETFLETTIGKTINTAIDIGLRAVLPDLIENQVIELKDNLINYGLKDGISKSVESAIDLGKSTLGIVTGNFDSISQMQTAIQSGGIIDSMSDVLDVIVDKVKGAGLINSATAKLIKNGKNIILDNIESNIESTFNNQIKSVEKVEKYINGWNECFKNKDFNGMEKEYDKLEKEIKNLVPLEKIIDQARTIENLHILIKNNGQGFNLTEEEIELARKLK